ncbi:MAG: DEAD/DEAH box helicase [Spirochaetaceae bacterium]|nr:DEAD/DEAH box helicase [Spirochaetaceae bacterium]
MNITDLTFKPGSLVRVRGRTCVVQPESTDELLVARPLGGKEEETQAVYLPLGFDAGLERTEFPLPSAGELGNLAHGRILFDAARLSLRETCGPFRCFGKLAFRPRAYQLVPLVMALRQDKAIRLMIADDVGIGKTVEALLIAKELVERAEVRRFAVVCPPHLCDQWAEELREKFGIEAVVVRSSTAGALDRAVPDNRSIWQYYPFQVISVDYAKADSRWRTFVDQAPELVIVDEAHTCACPEGAQEAQQQRHNLVAALARDGKRHMLFLTATPHSGKDAEFQSLLGLLDPEFSSWDLAAVAETERKRLSASFIQRRRQNIEAWFKENDTFPKRPPTREASYSLSGKYRQLFEKVLGFARELTNEPGIDARGRRLRYWTALALLRGVMSSPASAAEMLKHRLDGAPEDELADDENPVLLAEDETGNDVTQGSLLEEARLGKGETAKLRELIALAEAIDGKEDDIKTLVAAGIAKKLLAQGYKPVVFCRYIATANYVAQRLRAELGAGFDVRAITSEYPDEERKRLILEMRASPKRVLVATDCLSEGINLQELFTAVLHYDLPWNPNRLEQREGRVDRFGQTSPEVRTALIFGEDNPIDSVVLRVLLRKVHAIRDTLGISIPFPEDSRPLMDAIFNEVVTESRNIARMTTPELPWDCGDLAKAKEAELDRSLERAKDKAKLIRSVFAHEGIKADELEADLKAADEAAGAPEDVERFATETVRSLYGGVVEKTGKGWRLDPSNLPEILRNALGEDGERGSAFPVSFHAPVPDGHRYIGRLNRLVSSMCEDILSRSLDKGAKSRVARASVVETSSVAERTIILLVRARNLIRERREGRQIVAEELLLWGWRGLAEEKRFLSPDETERLMREASPSGNLSQEAMGYHLEEALGELPGLKGELDALALGRAMNLASQHERYRDLTKGKERFEAVEPALPPDLVGLYVFLPGGRA